MIVDSVEVVLLYLIPAAHMHSLLSNNHTFVTVIDKPFKALDPARPTLWHGDVESFLDCLPDKPFFDLAVTSPPYNIGKKYEIRLNLSDYLITQERIIRKIVRRVSETGSICWQVGNYVEKGEIIPLDVEIHPIFRDLGLQLRNRIVWRFGHGLHSKRRFSGRYEVVMWYTKTKDYKFNLDDVRIPSKYPSKRHYKGPNRGRYSSHPLGKNPEDVWVTLDLEDREDVWDIPNVKSNHVEKTEHPCQFPVGLIERLVLALTDRGDLVFDPFAGVGSAGMAAAIHGRSFWGCELDKRYVEIAEQRINAALCGEARYRPHDKPIYDHTKSKLSKLPESPLGSAPGTAEEAKDGNRHVRTWERQGNNKR